MDFDKFKANGKISLAKTDTKSNGTDKEAAKIKTAQNIEKLKTLQEALYAEHTQSLLIVLQAIDGGGKDGTIENIFGPLNSAGTRVAAFKVPTPIEADHDFLWRVHAQAPAKGEIVVFNRSHYEQVLVVKVHELEPKEVNKTRYDQINEFEKLLKSGNTHILKFFLHISKEEQLQRFGDRLNDPTKHWKLSAGDYAERALWDDYMGAFEELLEKCSKEHAPWFVIPADNKWYRDYVISEILVKYLEDLKIGLPVLKEDIGEIKRLYEAEVAKGK